MSANSFLKQYSDERAALVQSALPKAAAIVIGRRRVLSGIRWNSNLIVTAAEAIGGAEHVDVRLDGDELGAEVVATDLTTDVAILSLESDDAPDANHPATSADTRQSAAVAAASGDAGGDTAPVSSSAPSPAPASANIARPSTILRVGEPIIVVGRTLRGATAVWGSVQLTGPAWNSRRGGRIDQRLELDVAFAPSFEGAAVLDMAGNVAAMAVPGPYHRVLGIPTATIEAVVSKLNEFGHLPKPYIGIRLQPLWLDDDTRSKLGRKTRGIAAVGGVDAGSPAAEAHIELGDLLLTVDGEQAESVNGLAHRIASTNPGQTVEFEVLRGGKPLTIKVQVGERPHH
jgi:S1-C subfamily serine protease